MLQKIQRNAFLTISIDFISTESLAQIPNPLRAIQALPQKRPLFTWFPRHLLCLFHPTQTLVAAHSLMLPRSAAVQLMLTSNGVEAELSPFLRLAHSRCRSTYPVVEKQNSETAVSPLSQDPPRWRSSSRKNRRSAAALPKKNAFSSLVALARVFF